MKAMILAAGFGTRLKPLTETIPKALVPVHGIPMLEFIIPKLKNCGVTEIVINLHHFPEQIKDFVRKNNSFDIHVEFSFEPEILGTGGGIRKAASFLRDSDPFIVHNVDILSTVNLKEVTDFHLAQKSLATLVVKERKTTRFLVIDEKNRICGHEDVSRNRIRIRREPVGSVRRLGFCGIHVISPKIFDLMTREGRFSIIDVYLDLIEKGYPVGAFDITGNYWRDVGKVYSLDELEDDFRNGMISVGNLTSSKK
ncbi:MAG: nucleotidyltransferase family protein [Calditrichaeota bacterium]|nr:nucleotidyltransferase family protein [Calditrichota bacterium]